MQQPTVSGLANAPATLSGSHNGRNFTLEVSGLTWDRFRDWKRRFGKDATTGALLAEMADSRRDLAAEFSESDVNWYMDALDSFVFGNEQGTEAPAAPDTA